MLIERFYSLKQNICVYDDNNNIISYINNSTITVDVEAKVSAPVASNVNVGKATRIINPEEFGIDPGEANICEGCQ
jgi:hypothetical protein